MLGSDRTGFVHRIAGHVHQASERAAPTGTEIGAPVSSHLHPAHQALGRIHRDAAHGVFAQMLRHFEHQVAGAVVDRGIADPQRVQNRRQRAVGELDVDDVAENLVDTACCLSTHGKFFSRTNFSRGAALAAQCFGAADDVHQFAGDRGLARAVHLQRQPRRSCRLALLVAASIAVMRAPCSLASASSSA